MVEVERLVLVPLVRQEIENKALGLVFRRIACSGDPVSKLQGRMIDSQTTECLLGVCISLPSQIPKDRDSLCLKKHVRAAHDPVRKCVNRFCRTVPGKRANRGAPEPGTE